MNFSGNSMVDKMKPVYIFNKNYENASCFQNNITN